VLLCSVHTYQVTLRESHGCIRGAELEVCLSSFSFGLLYIISPLLLSAKTVRKSTQYRCSHLPISQFNPLPQHKNTNYINKKPTANSTLLLPANTNFITPSLAILHVRLKHSVDSSSAYLPSYIGSVLCHRIMDYACQHRMQRSRPLCG
jgi:hypothetical protein